MSAESLSAWIVSILERRNIKKSDGRLLFSYDLSNDEYSELRHQLTQAISESGGIEALAAMSLVNSRLIAPPAAFVLYASEWWKHDYAGGVWDWSPIIESLGGNPDAFSCAQQLRTEFVVRGLAFWQLRPLDKGKRFIGSIVVNGGIPMRLLAQGDGPVAVVLSQVLRQAGRYRWGHTQVLESVSDRLIQLPAAYRRPEIAELLAQFVDAALQLKEEFQLEGVADPTARLDGVLPNWRRRFPVSLESEAAQTLLTGLVREAASQGVGAVKGLFVAERRLFQDSVTGNFSVESHVSHPTRMEAESLASIFGLNDAESVPRHFSIDLEAEVRQPYAEGRLVLGASDPVAAITSKKVVIRGRAACSELQLILCSSSGDKGAHYTLEGGSALPDEDPWIFAAGEAGYPVMVAAGGARLPHEGAWIALPVGWELECKTETEPVRELMCAGLPPRRLIYIRSDARVRLSGVEYRIRLSQVTAPSQIYQWIAHRLPEARGRSVFRDRQPPRLYRASEEGLQAVRLSDQQWRRPGTLELLTPKDARGPVEVRILDDGELVARQRIFVLPPEARIDYISGNAIGKGTVRFINWGTQDISPDVSAGVMATVNSDGLSAINIDLTSEGAPPSELGVHVRWPGNASELILRLPYPVTGGRFLRADGSVMLSNETVTLQEMIGMRLQIFDTNPAHPRRYEIQLDLGQGNLLSRFPIALDAGGARAEVRLIDYKKQIESMLGMFDDLDAKVKIGLVTGGKISCEIRVGRYSTTIRSESGKLRIPEDALGLIPVVDLERTRMLACPLTQPDVPPIELNPVRSEGVHTGCWAVEGMSSELAPWLVYPAAGSAVLFRPRVWVEIHNQEAQAASIDNEQVTELKNLSDAMSQADAEVRSNSIHSVLKIMSDDHRHASWPMLDNLWRSFHHLPLTALDVWRRVATQPKAVLSFLLSSGLTNAELTEALRRLHTETGWLPELTTVADLCEVAQAYWRYWAEEGLDRDRCRKYFKEELEGRLKLLSNEIPSLGPLIETTIFAATGSVSDLLLEVAGPSKKSTRELLRVMWDGGNSLVNSQLFLVNADREISIWPGRDFVLEHAWPAFVQACSDQNQQRLKSCINQLFWPQPQDRKFSVATLPVLCALWAATSTSRQWWSDPQRRLALKQIRDFDPIWFEQAYRQAFKVCMSIDGLVQLPAITDH